MRLLIFEPSFKRVEASLAPHRAVLTPIVVDTAGALTLDGAPVSAEDARPDLAWASGELYLSPAARNFLIAMLKSPSLRWVQSAAAGYDHPMFADIVRKGAKLTTSHGQAVGHGGLCARGGSGSLPTGTGAPRGAARPRVDAPPLPRNPRDQLARHRFRIDRTRDRRARPRVRGEDHRRSGAIPPRTRSPTRSFRSRVSPPALPRMDVVVLCLPASKTTRHLAGAEFFAEMKPDSVLVNVGRGSLVDEQALVSALDRGTPAHAVLDVFETEPLPQDSLLWAHPRVCITAHASGESGGQQLRNQALFLANLERFLADAPLLNEASPDEVLDQP